MQKKKEKAENCRRKAKFTPFSRPEVKIVLVEHVIDDVNEEPLLFTTLKTLWILWINAVLLLVFLLNKIVQSKLPT